METEHNYQETDLGNVSPNPRGEYDSKESYEYLDLVSYQGGSYLCLAELGTTIIGTAPEPGHNTEFWQMLTLPGGLTSEYVAMHDDVVNKAAQVEISRAAVEQAQQEVEVSQADVQQLHEDTVQAAQDAENSRDSAAGYAQSAEASRKAAAESEQNINAQMTGLDEKVSESVTKATGDIATARQQAVQAVTDQQNTSVQAVKDETEDYIENKKKEIDAKTDEVTQAVTQAGEKQLQDIANSLDSTLTESGKAADSKAVGDAIASVGESKANKSALATTDRKLDALWKLNQGITYQFEEDSEPAYQKTIPTGAQMASVKQIGGKAIVWNQLIDSNWFINSTSKEGVSFNNDNGLVTITENGERTSVSYSSAMKNNPSVTKGHKYYISGFYDDKHLLSNGNGFSSIVECLDSGTTDLRISIKINDVLPITLPIQLFDLTKMFGAGNEPSTPEEFEAMFPEDYYPYNNGELMSVPVKKVVRQGKNLFSSQILNNFPDKCKIEEDGSITTWNNTSNYVYPMSEYAIELEAGTYMMSVTGDIPFTIYLQKDDSDYSTNVTGNVKNRQFTVDKKTSFRVMFSLESNMPVTNFKLQIEKDLIATSYSSYHKREYQIPQAILDLPGYGWSAGVVCNEVDWENKKYIQRVTEVDLGSLSFTSGEYEKYTYFNTQDLAKLIAPDTINTLCNRYTHATVNSVAQQKDMEIVVSAKGQLMLRNDSMNQDTALLKEDLKDTVLYYELAEPIVTNIADIIPEGFLEAMEVEAGGSLTFQNSNGDSYKVPLPNTVEYAVKLSEVAE